MFINNHAGTSPGSDALCKLKAHTAVISTNKQFTEAIAKHLFLHKQTQRSNLLEIRSADSESRVCRKYNTHRVNISSVNHSSERENFPKQFQHAVRIIIYGGYTGSFVCKLICVLF